MQHVLARVSSGCLNRRKKHGEENRVEVPRSPAYLIPLTYTRMQTTVGEHAAAGAMQCSAVLPRILGVGYSDNVDKVPWLAHEEDAIPGSVPISCSSRAAAGQHVPTYFPHLA